MYSLAAFERPYEGDGRQDYEVVTSTDRGLVFRSPDDELIWMEVDGASDVLIDDAPLPQEEPVLPPYGSRGRRPRREAPGLRPDALPASGAGSLFIDVT